MSDPKRHDIFEDENGKRVAVRQVFPPNALGISYVEYKNLVDSNLRFLPQAEFLGQFKWVENFGSTDTFAESATLQAADTSSQDAGVEAKGTEEEATPAVSGDDRASEQSPTAKPNRLE